MEKLDLTNLVQRHCKLTQKWAVVLYPDPEVEHNFDELRKAIPFLVVNECGEIEADDQAVADGLMIVLCDSEEECDTTFESIKGDDKNDVNDYEGPCRVYSWTCGPDGEILTENT